MASAPPVSGGLGALDAALIACVSDLYTPVGAAVSSELICRLLTCWLTIPLGWISLKVGDERTYV